MKMTHQEDKENSIIEGTLIRVSTPRTFVSENEKNVHDYYYLGIKTNSGDRVMVYISTTALGWFGDLNKSKVYYYNEKKKREIKTSLMDPDQFVGKKFRITGFLETINEKEKKFRMNHVQRIVIWLS